MALNLGSSAVSLYLGSQAVNAYLGGTLVTPPAGITLYYNGVVDADWATLGNWWLNAGHTVPATALPTAADSVVVSMDVYSNSGGTAAVNNLQVEVSGLGNGEFEINISVAGSAAFFDGTSNRETLTGNATFNDSSRNQGVVTGTATFNDSACNDGGTAGTFVPNPPPSC